MIRHLIIVLTVCSAALPALAAGPAAPTDPAQSALVQMLQEAQAREAQALVQVYTLRAQVAAEKARADAAEAKLKVPEQASEAAPKP